MKTPLHAIATTFLFLACGADASAPEGTAPQPPVEESQLAQVLTTVAASPQDVAMLGPIDLASCLDLPAQGATLPELRVWLANRMAYRRGPCFAGWAITLEVTDCRLGGGPPLSGAFYVTGPAMSAVAETGLLVKAAAVVAGATDLYQFLVGGKDVLSLDAGISGQGGTLAACSLPTASGRHGSFDLGLVSALVGQVQVRGAGDVVRQADLRTVEASGTVDVRLPAGIAVHGTIAKRGVVHRTGARCPEAGSVVVTASAGDAPTQTLTWRWISEGVVLIENGRGEISEPVVLPFCAR